MGDTSTPKNELKSSWLLVVELRPLSKFQFKLLLTSNNSIWSYGFVLGALLFHEALRKALRRECISLLFQVPPWKKQQQHLFLANLCIWPYHCIQQLDASMQFQLGLTVKTEEKPSDRLFLTDADIVPFCRNQKTHTHFKTFPLKKTPTDHRSHILLPMLFPSSVHWLIWGKRRISFHFLLLPFRFPPPPVVINRRRKCCNERTL